MAAGKATGVVGLAFGCSLAVALATFSAVAWCGASALLAAAILTFVAASSQVLLLVGLARSDRDVYFWTFIVALLLFSMGAGVAIYEGVQRIARPQPIAEPQIAYAVIGTAVALVAMSTWTTASVAGVRGAAMLRQAADAAAFTLLLEQIAALAGLAVALAGILAVDRLGLAEADGAAALAIGLILGAVAAVLCLALHGLISGDAAVADAATDAAETAAKAGGLPTAAETAAQPALIKRKAKRRRR